MLCLCACIRQTVSGRDLDLIGHRDCKAKVNKQQLGPLLGLCFGLLGLLEELLGLLTGQLLGRALGRLLGALL